MSLFGAMQSGISGMAAQSNAMGAISDNISNVNTIGYKGTNVSFQTLVTKQTSSNFYSPGGVQPVSKQGIDVQGLLSSTSSSTALAISGSGYFVVNQAANPQDGDAWAYTRAGDFSVDTSGYLKNTGGFYAQGWTLLPWDGTATASTVEVNGVIYMKAYYASDGSTVYINDNIVDSNNLQPINLATIGGTASPTQQISFGANLPADDPVFDLSNPDAGGYRSISALIYDSLGNSSNLSLNFIKESTNSWGMSVDMPSGAANLILTGNKEVSDGGTPDVYYAAGQLEFTGIPANGSSITITDQSTGVNYIFDFLNTATPAIVGDADNVHTKVDIQNGITSLTDFINAFNDAIQSVMPGANRFSATSNSIQIVQSEAGSALTINASQTQTCVQAAANPIEATGVPSGEFEIPEIAQELKNTARLDFTSTEKATYLNNKFQIDGVTFTFVQDNPANNTQIDLSKAKNVDDSINTVKLVSLIADAIQANVSEPNRFVASGSSLEIMPTATGGAIKINMNNLAGVVGELRNNGGAWVSSAAGDNLTNTTYTISNSFTTNGIDVEQGSMVPAVRFNSDGTPKYFYVDDMSIQWANGAQNMDGSVGNGTTVGISMGNTGTTDGLTSLAGSFSTNYIKQDGAKYGSYSGVTVSENGVVTALFDNGETRPIAILPLATFTNPNGMSALTGNAWIETDASGQPLLKQAGVDGAGEVSGNALETSTVDLATEFSNMIVTQRAYSASTKIITTADEMLEELTRLI